MTTIVELIRRLIPEYDTLHPIQKQLLEKYFYYRVLFNLHDRIGIKHANIERAKQIDEAYIRKTTPYGVKRSICKFGEKCFRNNPVHLRDFLHYRETTKKTIERYNREIENLKIHGLIHESITHNDNHTDNKNNETRIIEAAKEFADFVLTQYQSLETDRFMRLLSLLGEFEQPINPEYDSQEYGLECPGFAIITTWIVNIRDPTYGNASLTSLFSILDQIPISGSYDKERIHREMPLVYQIYAEQMYPNQSRSIRDDPLVSNNTLMDYLDKLDMNEPSLTRTHHTIKRRRIITDEASLARLGEGVTRRKKPKRRKKSNKSKPKVKRLRRSRPRSKKSH
jgi:hypothetical protein